MGTLISYFVLRLFLSEWLGWGLELLLGVGFFLVWYWGGYFLSSLLMLAMRDEPVKPGHPAKLGRLPKLKGHGPCGPQSKGTGNDDRSIRIC